MSVLFGVARSYNIDISEQSVTNNCRYNISSHAEDLRIILKILSFMFSVKFLLTTAGSLFW